MKPTQFLRHLAVTIGLAIVAPTIMQARPDPAPRNTAAPDAPRRFEAEYPVPYAPMSVEEIKAVLDRVLTYLDSCTPARLVDRETGEEIL